MLQYLAVGALPEKLPEPCLHLEFLSVCVSFSDLDEILTLLCLFRSSPALKNLEILVSFVIFMHRAIDYKSFC